MAALALTPVQVVGIGLDGAAGLSIAVKTIVERATVLVGSDRHLSYFPDHPAERLPLQNIAETLAIVRHRLNSSSGQEPPLIVILASGDPLFFGLGRLLLTELLPHQLTFHPHLSAIQLAFSRIKMPWQDARLISAHGRSLEELTQALQQGADKIAVLTDGANTPAAIARLLLSLDLPQRYECWVCEDLGGASEQVQQLPPEALLQVEAAPLNVVVLSRIAPSFADIQLDCLPTIGIADRHFLSFRDRPGLMTKREIRLLALGELALRANLSIWDVGAGTGSVSIEIARLSPSSRIYAVEKTAAGYGLIQQNSDRFGVKNVHPICGAAPAALADLPRPDRVFIGGSGGQIEQILTVCGEQLLSGGVIVLAIATVEHLSTTVNWLQDQTKRNMSWQHRLLQVQLARSTAIANLTRFTPLNPVTLVTLFRDE